MEYEETEPTLAINCLQNCLISSNTKSSIYAWYQQCTRYETIISFISAYLSGHNLVISELYLEVILWFKGLPFQRISSNIVI